MTSGQTMQEMDLFQKLFARLNSEQQLAVTSTEGPVLVIAGPGTGKTQILAMRIANILQSTDLQMNPSNILCMTFTESGVSAMRERLLEIVGTAAYQVRVHTFHSFCNEVIQAHPEIFMSRSALSDIEKVELFNQLIDELDASSPLKPFGDPYIYRRDIMSLVREMKQEYISVSDLLEASSQLDEFINEAATVLENFTNIDLRRKPKPELHEMEKPLEELATLASRLGETGRIYYQHIYGIFARAEKIIELRDEVKDFVDAARKNSPRLKELARIYQRYSEELINRKLYDYEDMILRVIAEFSSRPELLAEYQEQFQYILVDEYQDTNGAQNHIIKLLASHYQENPNLFVVGDDDQSIYRFQGASVENIFDFKSRYKAQLSEILLKDNYRSQQGVLDSALSTIRNNTNRLAEDKVLISRNGRAASPVIVSAYNSVYEEAYAIAQQIQELISSGVDPSEIAVLYREHRHSETIATALYKLGVPCLIKGQENVLENLEILQLVDLLKVIHRPKDSNIVFRLLNYNFLREGELLSGVSQHDVFKVVADFRKQGREQNLSFIEYLASVDKFKAFADAILHAGYSAENLSFELFFEKIIRDFNYLATTLNSSNRIERINNLSALFTEIKKLEQNGSPLRASKLRHQRDKDTGARFDLEDFIYYVDTAIENSVKLESKPVTSNRGAVQLMSAHGSKGLEFDHVFIYSCIDKSWGNKTEHSKIKLPLALSLSSSAGRVREDTNEDERRLFYVALTRAREAAHISYHLKSSNARELSPSMFIGELSNIERANTEKLSEIELEMLAAQFAYVDNTDNILSLEHDFIDGLLNGYKLSVTHLNNYLRCPRLFFYQNLLRVPAAKTKHACFGSAVHNALFDLGTRIRSGSSANDLEFLLARFEQRLLEENMSSQDYNDSLAFGKDTLTKYFNQYKDKFYDTSLELLLEYNFGHKGLSYEGIELEGKLDKIEIDADGKAVVVDYKTGNPTTKSKSLKPDGDYHRQIVFYRLLVDLARKSGLFKAEMLRGEIDFVQSDADGKFHKQAITVTDNDLTKLKQTIVEVVGQIKAQNFDKTTDRRECERCDFNSICWK
jgi:DNA helicase-2/ATP-dependent DNA helicase PcrA